jgi:hypothetical protein
MIALELNDIGALFLKRGYERAENGYMKGLQ